MFVQTFCLFLQYKDRFLSLVDDLNMGNKVKELIAKNIASTGSERVDDTIHEIKH